MQRKLIALAVAGLVSGGAYAQSSVTVYGVADVSDVYASDSYTKNAKSTNAIASGSSGLNGSRLGFKGTEDLGDGLSVNFRMEGGINLDTGTSAQGGQLMGRWATVGLTSAKYGTVEGGRRDTFQDQLLAAASGNGRNTVAANNPVYVDQQRYNNFVAYLSPVWDGLQLKLGYASNGTDPAAGVDGQDQVPTEITSATQNVATSANLRVYTAALHYVNGPLLLGAAYDYNALQDRNVAAGVNANGNYGSGNVWNIAGAYDFGVVRIDAAFGAINYANNTLNSATTGAVSAETKDKREQWTVGAVIPLGTADRLMFNYAHAKISYLKASTADDKISLWGANYIHDLSKRTALYASLAKIDQDDTTTTKASLNGTGTGYQQAIQVGIRHSF